MLLSISSCLPETPDPPYGVWVGGDPQIMLFLKPQYRMTEDWPTYIGLYMLDGEEIKVFVRFGHGLSFRLSHQDSLQEGGGFSSSSLLVGSYRVVRNQIHYTLTPHFQEQVGIQTIIFHRVEDYDPIDPYNWSPYFFPRTRNAAP